MFKIKLAIKSLISLFLAFAIAIVNLPHASFQAQAATKTQDKALQCKLVVDLKQGLYFSDIDKNCCKGFDALPSQRTLVNEVEPTTSKDIKDFTIIETNFALAILMIGILSITELQKAEVYSNAFAQDPTRFFIGRLLSFGMCENGFSEFGISCDDNAKVDLKVCSCGPIKSNNEVDKGRSPNTGKIIFKDPFSGKVFSKEELTSFTKPNSSNIKRINLEKAIGNCVSNSICSNQNNFQSSSGLIKPQLLGEIIDVCLTENANLLPNQTQQCKLNLDLNQGTINSEFSKNCCRISEKKVLNRSEGIVEKELRNLALVFVLFAVTLVSMLGLTHLIDTQIETKMVSASRDSKLALYAAEAGLQEAIVRLNQNASSSSGNMGPLSVYLSEDERNSLKNIGRLNITEEEASSKIPDLNKIDKSELKQQQAKKRLDKIQNKLSDFIASCSEQILCANSNLIFKDGKLDQRILPTVTNICLNRVGIALLGDSNHPCICTYKGCFCKPNAICREGMCSSDPQCSCNNDGECLCPLNRVCEKLRCQGNNCICEDGLCNTDSDCISGEKCVFSNTLNQTFSGVPGSISSSGNASSGGTFSGVAGSLSGSSGSSNDNCGLVCPVGTILNTVTCTCDSSGSNSSSTSSSSGGTFSGVFGSIGSSTSSSSGSGTRDADCDGICDPPKVFNSSTCMCECPSVKCPAGTYFNPITCQCSLFKGICKNIQSSSGCINGESCDDGNSCTANDRCTSGKCTGTEKSCDDGNSCTNDTCDAVTGVCTYAKNPDCKECTDNSECASGLCIESPRGSVCTKTAEDNCPEDYPTKICVPKFCKKNSECGSIGVCKNGKCVVKPGIPKVCKRDDDCDKPKGEVCDDSTKTCVKPKTCDRDDDCDSTMGQSCDSQRGICVLKPMPEVCQRNEDCDNLDEDCDTQKGICIPRTGTQTCNNNTDCNRGSVCNGGRCTSPCEGSRGDCAVIPITCSNIVCGINQACENGQCLTKCTSNIQCGDRQCNSQKGICEPAKTCQLDNDCNNNEKCGINNKCIKLPLVCLRSIDCRKDQICFQGKCWNINCITNADCPPVQHDCNNGICVFKP